MAVNMASLIGRLEPQSTSFLPPSPSLLNFMRIVTVADRLVTLAGDSNTVTDPNEFINLCLTLSRGIDFAVAHNDIPAGFENLPGLLKQVCQSTKDPLLLGAVMTLMVTVKNACNLGLFVGKDSEDLLAISNEIGISFCTGEEFSGQSDSLSNVTTIMSRFYPWLRMGQILTFIEAKTGYGTYMKDFQIQKTLDISPNNQIRLFVARTDCMENSSCILSPPQVNFLLNGKGVDKRTNVTLDKNDGPLMPTNVTQLLTYGSNILQAVGEFNGNYIIIVAFMIAMPNVTLSVQDYVLAVTSHDSDPEIVEGASRISLNCPISFKRIKTPVKGQSCKHRQCFEFDNFVEINSRRPSWRCPHCSQSVFLDDIRVDQTMVKILKEVNEAVTDVIISMDGSWEAVTESNDDADQPHSTNANISQDTLMMERPSNGDIVDLTEDANDVRFSDACELQDVKPVLTEDNQTQSCLINSTVIDRRNMSSSTHMDDDFWAGLYLPAFQNLVNEEQESPSSNPMPSPPSSFANAVSSALNGESQASGHNSAPAPAPAPVFRNMVTDNEYGRMVATRPGSMAGRAPILNQGQLQMHHFQAHSSAPAAAAIEQRPRGISITSTPAAVIEQRLRGISSTAANSIPEIIPRQQQQPSRPHLTSPLNVSPLQLPISQVLDQRNRLRVSNQTATGHPPLSPHFNAQRVSAALSNGYQNQQTQSIPSHTTSNLSSIPTWSSVQPSSSFQQARQAQVRSAGPMSRQLQPSPVLHTPVRFNPQDRNNNNNIGNLRGGIQQQTPPPHLLHHPHHPPPHADSASASEPDWRPTGRMRGSLSGQAYSDAHTQFIMRPQTTTTTTQSTRPLSQDLPGVPPLHLINARNRMAQISQAVNLSSPSNQNNNNNNSDGSSSGNN